MSIYNTAVNKPISTLMVFIAIMVLGVASYIQLPVDQYPKMDPPYLTVMATYPGANASDIEENVTKILEDQLNSVDNLKEMTSTSYDNLGVISLEFEWEANLDEASNDVRDAVDKAMQNLPDDIDRPTIMRFNTSMMPILIYAVTADQSYPGIDKILDDKLITRLNRVDGVASVIVAGAPERVVYVDLDPNKLDAYNLTLEQIGNKILAENKDVSSGNVKMGQMDYALRVEGEFEESDQIKNIVLGTQNNKTIYLHDVAVVRDTIKDITLEQTINRGRGGVLLITKQTDANAVAVAKEAKKQLELAMKELPSDIKFQIISDNSDFIVKSINNLQETLMYALIFVVLVVFLFLGRWRATFIIALTIPISLIVAFIYLFATGESLNVISLSSLSIAIGMVVDDAIVVVENVEHLMETEKLSPYEATKKAMNGLASALIATSLVLCAVFVPVSFLSGITGQLYRQFTITIAVSVLLSTVVALTLSPVMCSLILRPDSGKKKNIVFRKINQWLNLGNHKYIGVISRVIKNPRRLMSAFGLVLVAIFIIHRLVPTSFLPTEDQGYFKIELELPEGATLERTRVVTDRAVKYLEKNPFVAYVQNVTGSSPRVGSSQARSELTVILKPWEDRKSISIDKIMENVEKDLKEYPECKVYLSTPPVIPGLGTSGGFELQLEARGEATFDDLVQAADTLMYYAQRNKELTGLSSSLQSEIPQLYFDVDRDKVKMLGVPLADVFSTMKAYTGSVYVNDFNMFNRIYKVYIQAEAPYREHKDNINLFFVKAKDGAMIPLTSLGNASYTTGPGSIKRFNMFTTAVIRGSAAQGYSSGQAMEVMEQIARDHLPDNIGLEWSGLSYQEKKAGGQTGLVLTLVFLFVFLFLAAQYESWTVPIAVLLSLPVAALGAYLGVAICGLENDIYFQIGLVMLMGLAAKNAILIVEFAKVQVDKGGDLVQSAIHAAQLRFRPILMTSLAFVLGMLPMVLASGPGSASRQAIGTGVFFGMIFAIVFGIVLVPFFFVMVYKTKAKVQHKIKKD